MRAGRFSLQFCWGLGAGSGRWLYSFGSEGGCVVSGLQKLGPARVQLVYAVIWSVVTLIHIGLLTYSLVVSHDWALWWEKGVLAVALVLVTGVVFAKYRAAAAKERRT
jgi:hypothetical protein